MIAEKTTLDKSKKEAEDKAIAVENERDRKIRTIGNYVHDSVPVSQTEVRKGNIALAALSSCQNKDQQANGCRGWC